MKDANPALKIPEVGKTGSGSKVANVDIFIIDPNFCFCIIGVTSRTERITFKR